MPAAPAGGSPSQTYSASSSAATARPARVSSAASATRSRAPGIVILVPPAWISSGPRNPKFTLPRPLPTLPSGTNLSAKNRVTHM